MRFLLLDDFWVLDSLYPTEWEWIRELPRLASGRDFSPSSRERLFPPPLPGETLADEGTLSLLEDWDELIRPELLGTFAEARRLVEEDLARGERIPEEEDDDSGEFEAEMEEAGFPPGFQDLYRVAVPHEHSEAWYSTLNQARLLLNEEYDLASSEDRYLAKTLGPEAVGEAKLLLIARYELYSVIQSILVENLMSD